MAEYIEKSAAVKIAERYGLSDGSVLGKHSGIADCIAEEISQLPAADVAPVVHGRWIEDGSGIIICQECKRGYNLIAKYTHYCPNCGAKMDGGDDHEVD